MPWPSVPDVLTIELSHFARRVWHDQLVLQSTVELSLLRFLTEPRYSRTEKLVLQSTLVDLHPLTLVLQSTFVHLRC